MLTRRRRAEDEAFLALWFVCVVSEGVEVSQGKVELADIGGVETPRSFSMSILICGLLAAPLLPSIVMELVLELMLC